MGSPGRIAGSIVTLTDGATHASQGILSILGDSRPFLGLFRAIPREDVKTVLKQCYKAGPKCYTNVKSMLHFVFCRPPWENITTNTLTILYHPSTITHHTRILFLRPYMGMILRCRLFGLLLILLCGRGWSFISDVGRPRTTKGSTSSCASAESPAR